MNYASNNPNFTNYAGQQNTSINPAPFPQIPYKPITFERLSNLIGVTYNLSAIENINTIPLPRGSGEQQIFFVNNDEKIYARSFDNSIGIVGYKEDYVQKLENELKEAQEQLQIIFNEIIGTNNSNDENNLEEKENKTKNNDYVDERFSGLEDRLSQMEKLLNNFIGGIENGSKKFSDKLEGISEVA